MENCYNLLIIKDFLHFGVLLDKKFSLLNPSFTNL